MTVSIAQPRETRHPSASPASLDGLTILRYAHAYESGGGLEQHLADLNRALSERNRLTTVQIQLTADPARVREGEQVRGSSRLITIPLLAKPQQGREPEHASAGSDSWRARCRQFLWDHCLTVPGIYPLLTKQVLRWRRIPRRPGEPSGAGRAAREVLSRYAVDLVVLHSSGGADASEVLQAARGARVPVALVHHFSNDRLQGPSMRWQLEKVDGVGGASWVGVPAFLKGRFFNLSDAVDTDFYQPANARSFRRGFDRPVLYAPSRITPLKGQSDVIEVAAALKQRGLETIVIFAGRVDSAAFEAELRAKAAHHGLEKSVEFLGQISLEEYRDWFGVASVMVMPTYHHEGMPRTLIDSQAMGVPPVVYDIGGTSEGLRHQETGFLVPLGNVAGVIDAVEALLRQPALRNRISKAGRRFVEDQFSLQAFAGRHERFYLQVMAAARGRSAARA